MAEGRHPGVSAEQLVGFMDGTTLGEYQGLVQRTEEGVAAQTRLAALIADGTTQQLAAALRDIFREAPELRESPAIKILEAKAQPQHKHTPLLDACIEADVPAYLHGEAGSGKSTASENAAAVRGMNWRGLPMSPQSSKADFLGYRDANGVYNSTGFREIFEHGGIFLFDEIDNGNPSATATMNMALAGWRNEFPDGLVERNWNTRIIAAANTIGRGATAQFVGRNPIDAATLDRFAMIPWDIDEHLENKLMKVETGITPRPIDIARDGVPTRREWLDEVRGYRSRAAASGLRVVISPRSAIYGAKLAEQGVGVKWLTEMLIYKGMSDTDRQKLRARF